MGAEREGRMSKKKMERVRFNAFLLLDTVEILGTYRYSGK